MKSVGGGKGSFPVKEPLGSASASRKGRSVVEQPSPTFAFSAHLVVSSTDEDGNEFALYREKGDRKRTKSPTVTFSNQDLGVDHGEMPEKVFVMIEGTTT